jgi:hypothetical protein
MTPGLDHPPETAVNTQPAPPTPPTHAGPSPLELLEVRIDDCMMSARRIDAEGL